MATYHFYLRKDKARTNGEAPVYLRITANRKSKYVSTGVFVKPNKWNAGKEEVRRNHRSYKSMNSILQNKKDNAINIQSDLSNHNKDSAKAIQNRLKKQLTGDFFDLADNYLEELENHERFWAKRKTKVVLKKLKNFEGGTSLPLQNIDANYLERFEGFLKTEYDNSPTTINKNFEPIKAIIKKALKNHLIGIDPFEIFDGAKRGRPKPKTKLSIKQIKLLESLKLKKDSALWHTRNYFMFSFYSGGVRFGDLCCLKWKNIDGNKLIYEMNKNGKRFSSEINLSQRNILDLYEQDNNPGDFIFPILNNHKDYSDPGALRKKISSRNVIVNKNLKKLAGLANEEMKNQKPDIPKLNGVSFHVARHSFAQHAVESGLSMYELRQTLKHSKIETTQKYLKGLDDELADKAMKKVFQYE